MVLKYASVFNSFSWLCWLFISVFYCAANLNLSLWEKLQTIGPWDQLAYYSYLPAAFIHHDFSFQKLAGTPFYPVMHLPGPKGLPVLNMTCGVALLQLPFFAVAYLHCHLAGYEVSGFSLPFHLWAQIGCAFYVFLGLFYLRKVLLRYFSEFAAGLTLLLIALATQLFYYSTSEPLMSHAYSFALLAVFLYLFPIWQDAPSYKKSILIGFVVGLLIAVRPTNIFLFILGLGYGAHNWKTWLSNLAFALAQKKYILIMFTVIGLLQFPQMLYWKLTAGSWLYDSYTALNPFHFLHPRPYLFLLSYRKGLLIYAPVLLFAFWGLYFLVKKKNPFGGCSAVYMCSMIYIFSSWWCWWYGGGFGQRSMIDTFSVLALGLASFIELVRQKGSYASSILIAAALLIIGLYQFQNFQYQWGIIHYDSMTRKAYWAVFMRLAPPPGYYETMLLPPDYEKARKDLPEYAE
jgi:hypothetical protein